MLEIIEHAKGHYNTGIKDIILASNSSRTIYYLYKDEDHFARRHCINSFSSRDAAIAFIRGIAYGRKNNNE